jgi:hypothetical protein
MKRFLMAGASDVFVTVPHEKIRTIKPDNEEDQGLPEVVAAHTQVRMPSLEQYDYDLTS